ncbi:hydroxyethylthiazole kinase [Candidatus Latescibacterota bacterium]
MDGKTVSELLTRVRREKPLVHQITNWVTIGDCASVTRAFGALPVMAHAQEEAADMAGIASALVLNIGTLTPGLVEAMILAARRANDRGIPVVLDAVGVGATPLRNDKAAQLLDTVRIDIVKGNISEVARLAGEDVRTHGVEATDVALHAGEVAKTLAITRKVTVVITGVADMVSDGVRTFRVKNGHALMSAVVGTGCMAAAVIGAFAAVEPDHATAAAAAVAAYGIAGECAAARSEGPGSYKVHFFDEAYRLDSETIERMALIVEI